MKRFYLFLFILIWFTQIVHSQNANPKVVRSIHYKAYDFRVSMNANNAKVELIKQLNIPKDYEFRSRIVKGTKDQIVEYDELGYAHEHYELFYKNIKVEDADIRTHFLNNELVAVNGEYIDVPYIDISVRISRETAIQKAMEHIGAREYVWEWEPSCNPVPELIICRNWFNAEDTTFYIAYKVEIFAMEPHSHDDIYVDAKTGNILNKISNIRYDNGENPKARANGTAETRYSGTRNITTKRHDYSWGGYDFSLFDAGRNIETKNLKRRQYYYIESWTHPFFDDDNYWSSLEYDNANKDNGALDAQWGAMMTYDYFFYVHKRKGFCNTGRLLTLYVHYWVMDENWDDVPVDNAFWTSYTNSQGHGKYCIVFGDGKLCDIFTAIDIVAHEFGHGVEEFSVNMKPCGESGPLREGFSDIWGACVKNYAAPEKNRWLLGEDIGCVKYDMANPKNYGCPDTYGGINWGYLSRSVFSHWFYILTEGKTGTNDLGNTYNVAGIGIDKAAKIVYRAETKEMTSVDATFAKMRQATIAAAEYLYGEDCDEVISVTNAWYAVGVGDLYDCTKYITNKNYNSGTHDINGCKIVVSNTNVNTYATVNFKAEESVIINYDFDAVPGSKVNISIGTILPVHHNGCLKML